MDKSSGNQSDQASEQEASLLERKAHFFVDEFPGLGKRVRELEERLAQKEDVIGEILRAVASRETPQRVSYRLVETRVADQGLQVSRGFIRLRTVTAGCRRRWISAWRR